MVKVAVLDSAVDIFSSIFENANVYICDEFSSGRDEFENKHGTAVCEVIGQNIKGNDRIEFVIFPIFDENGEADPEDIIAALNYIDNIGDFQIVNMSMGFLDGTYEKEMDQICCSLRRKGTILVASFSNTGEMTYPACLDSVIGVDISNKIDIKDSYIFNKEGCVNIIFPDKQYSISFGKENIYLVRGTSFAAAELTGKIISYLLREIDASYEKLMEYLSQRAVKKIGNLYEKDCIKPEFEFGKIGLFPYCKETVSIVQSKEFLHYKLVGIYDYKYSSHIGEIIENPYDCSKFIVESEKNIPWNEIETLIVAYTAENNNLIKKIFYTTIHEAIEKGIRIYSFDDITKIYNNKQVWCPIINNDFLPKTQEGKLWYINKPVIGILGTRSRQGKFTTQIRFVRALQERSYDVGWISTEPAGYLFGADYVFAYGYHSTVQLNTEEYTIAINKMLHDMSKTKDINVIGLQGSVLHLNTGNINQLSIKQHALLFGAYTDVVILCVNITDDEILIESIINYLCACFGVLVIGILIYPMVYIESLSGNFEEIVATSQQLELKIKKLEEKFKCYIFVMNDQNISSLVDIIIDELSGE